MLSFRNVQISPRLIPAIGGCGNRSGGVYRVGLERTGGGRQPPAAAHSIHPLRRPPYNHIGGLLPWGKSSLAKPYLAQSPARYFSMRNSRWRAVLKPSRLDTKACQANNKSTRTANDIVMEEDEASEVGKCFNFQMIWVLFNSEFGQSQNLGVELNWFPFC